MILLIDDAKEGGWADIVARNAEAGLMVLGACQGNIEELHIDFDLGNNSENGLFVLQNAIELEILPNKVIIVSWNPVGRGMIKVLLLDNGFKFINNSRYERE